MKRSWLTVSALVGVLTVGLGCSDGDTVSGEQDCSVLGQNRFVHRVMSEYYLWADQAPAIDPAAFASPRAVLEAMIYRELDRWSGMQPARARAQYLNEGRYVGLGVQYATTNDGRVRIALTYPDSPARAAGLRRGMELVGINGRTLEEIAQDDSGASIDGPDEPGVTVVYDVIDPERGPARIELTKEWITLQTVLETSVLEVGERRVGYLYFSSFLGTSADELRAAFGRLKEAGANELVLDLRYNGGGLLSAAAVLASLIGGPEQVGEPLSELRFNRQHTDDNGQLLFSEEPNALGLSRLAVIAGSGTASASELLVNGLRVYMPVALVGGLTHGKPVGANTWEYCGEAITPITFHIVNAEGEGDYFDGMRANCVAPDDLEHALGDPSEARLAAALDWLRDGTCPSSGGRRLEPAVERATEFLTKDPQTLRPF